MKTIALEEIADIVQGGRLGLSGNNFVPHGHPAYGAGGLNGYLDTYEYEGDAVVLSSIGARCGKCFFASGRWTSLANTQVIRPDPKLADAKFLWFQLNDETRWPRSGTGQPFIKPSDVKSHRISLPSLPEQQRIAELLEQADRLHRTRRYALELSDTFLSAAFLESFGERFRKGSFRRFEELVKITGGGTPARERSEFYQGRIPWFTAKDMRGDYIWGTEEHITEDAIKHSATKLVPAGSILVVVKSKVLMHRLPVAIAKVALCHGQDIKSIQCSKELYPEFARFLLKFHESRLLNFARGANTEGLTLPMLEELPVPKVDIVEQERFVSLVSRHERLRAGQREALRQAKHLFQSLLHQAFTPGI